jgi:hypothetical protein
VVVAASHLGGDAAQKRMDEQNLPTPILFVVPTN